MDPRVQMIVRIVTENEQNGRLSAKQACSRLGLSEGHFLRLFKREVGMTFRRFRRETRIAGIASLLKQNALSVKQVAQVAGYEDVSNFHRDFKQVCGMTPRQWQLAAFSSRSTSIPASLLSQ